MVQGVLLYPSLEHASDLGFPLVLYVIILSAALDLVPPTTPKGV